MSRSLPDNTAMANRASGILWKKARVRLTRDVLNLFDDGRDLKKMRF